MTGRSVPAALATSGRHAPYKPGQAGAKANLPCRRGAPARVVPTCRGCKPGVIHSLKCKRLRPRNAKQPDRQRADVDAHDLDPQARILAAVTR